MNHSITRPQFRSIPANCTILLLITLLALTSPAWADTILIQSPEVVVRQAPLIVEATVREIQFVASLNESLGEAWVTLTISDRIVGESPSEIVIRRLFVTSDLRFLKSDWLPAYSIGESSIICLWPTENGYSTMGLYNGKFVIKDNFVNGTSLDADVFKTQIREIRGRERELFPADLPRQTAQGVHDTLGKKGETAKIMTAGSHLGGEFITWDFTWDPSYVPVQMQYNSAGATANAPSSSTIASLAQTAYDLWSDSYSFLTIQNASSFTTSEWFSRNSTSVIMWNDFGDTGFLAFAEPYPNDPANGVFLGPGSNTGVDIVFNNDIGSCTWYFSQTAPGSHNCSQVDFIEVLAHELGHGLGLRHVNNTNSVMLGSPYGGYLDRTGSVRGQTDGDFAAAAYQHTKNPLPGGSLPHSLVLSASSSTVDVSGTITVPSGKIFEVESGTTLEFDESTGVFSYGQAILNNVTLRKDPAGGPFSYFYLYGSGASGSTINDVTISGSTYGIHTNGISNADMNAIYATDNINQGLKLYNSSYVDITNSTFKNSNHYGVYVDACENVYFKSGPRFENNGYDGIAVRGSSSANFGGPYETADAVVKNNSRNGLNVYSSSYLNIGYGSFGGNNSVESNSSYNASVTTSSELVAEKTWWGSADENTILSTLFWDDTSTLHYNNWLTSPGPSKNATSPVVAIAWDNTITPASLVKLYGDLAAEDPDAAIAFLREHENDSNRKVAEAAGVLLVRALLRAGKMSEGIAMGSEILNDADFNVAGRASVAKRLFYTYLMQLNDQERAVDVLEELRLLGEEDFENGLLATVYEDVTGAAPVLSPVVSAKGEVNTLLAYPNPFNPETTIRFTVTKQSPIRLSVFDLLGREIAVLVDEVRNSGTHSVRFDATGFAAGVYFMRLKAGSEEILGKMLLAK